MKAKKFKIGSKVAWESCAHGSSSRKEGKVILVLAAGERPAVRTYTKHKIMFEGSCRAEESYLVEVKVGKTAMPRLYWPRTAHLTRA